MVVVVVDVVGCGLLEVVWLLVELVYNDISVDFVVWELEFF